MAGSCALHPGSDVFWHSRHCNADVSSHEWYCGLEPALEAMLKPLIKPSDSILVVGSGVSDWPDQLYDRCGCHDITVADASEPAMKACRTRNKRARAGIRYHKCDVTQGINFSNFSFDLVIDRGALDCVLCRENGHRDAEAFVSNLYGIMRSSAKLLVFSHGDPESRLPILDCCAWTADVQIRASPGTDLRAVAAGDAAVFELKDLSHWQATQALAFFLYTCVRG